MLTRTLIVAQKEILDGLRDGRGLISSLLYSGMGPGIVFMVSLATQGRGRLAVLVGMMSIFTLLSVFVGGMSVAMDVLAGERERRSLLPLLMNPLTRLELMLGKWLAVGFFSMGGLTVSLAGFGVVLASAGIGLAGTVPDLLFTLVCGLVPLALLAAALELAISAACRAVKEAHTYLSLLVFVPMAVGMFLVFFPKAAGGWSRVIPLIGQQLQMEQWMRGGTIQVLPLLALGLTTAAVNVVVLLSAAKHLERDDVLYGG